jgi:muramoyltetrapeptide carboxypeptidase
LNLGDTVGLIAPASSDDEPLHLENAQATVRGMGLVPKTGRHVSDIWGYFSGTDHDRAADIHAMFTDEACAPFSPCAAAGAAHGCCRCSTGI